jgi:signal transduction histidine kinase
LTPAEETSHERRIAREATPENAGIPRRRAAALFDKLSTLRAENIELRGRVLALELDLEAARRHSAELEELSAMAAHELIKPLVLGEATVTNILERSSSRLDIVTQEDLLRMARASARVRLVVEVLIADARESRGSVQRQHVDMSEVVRDCLELLRADISAKRARFDVGPMPVVTGNRALLSGAMGNLIANAIKYGPDAGTIHISVDRTGSSWMFGVESAGRPIAQRDTARIFQPWERTRTDRRTRGAGLGLAIVRRIVERHGGEVGVTALKGRGNRFYFTLPV